MTKQFNFSPWLALIRKNFDLYHYFAFWWDRISDTKLENLILNHSTLIQTFITYFLKEVEPLREQIAIDSYTMLDLVGRKHFYSNLPIQQTLEKDRLRKFLIEMGYETDVLKADRLTTRERDNLKHLLLGKSSKEMAHDMHLSPRTVEHHLERLKTKFDCSSKQELFSLAKKLQELGLI